MRLIRLLGAVLALASLVACGDDVETKIAQCEMSPESKRVGIPTCMSSMGYSTVSSEFCGKMLYTLNVHIPSCYEERGLWYRLKKLKI